jgi:hypothetical protein
MLVHIDPMQVELRNRNSTHDAIVDNRQKGSRHRSSVHFRGIIIHYSGNSTADRTQSERLPPQLNSPPARSA